MGLPETGYVENNFRLGVVTHIDEHHARCVMLHSRLTNGVVDEIDELEGWGTYDRYAIDSDRPQYFDDVIDVLEDVMVDTINTEAITEYTEILKPHQLGDKWSQIAPGKLIHLHEATYIERVSEHEAVADCADEICISPITLSAEGIQTVINRALDACNQASKRKIIKLTTEEQKLAEGAIQGLSDGIVLFEGIEWVEREDCSKRPVVPSRIIVSEKFGVLQLDIDCMRVRNEEDNDFGRRRWRVNGDEFWIPNIFPLEDTDERGIPLIKDRERVELRIRLDNPVRMHKKQLEEEKLLIEIGGKTFWAKPNEEILVGNQGFGGVDYVDFLPTDDQDRYHEIRTPGAEPIPPLWRASSILVPIDDIDALMELRLRLPGLNS